MTFNSGHITAALHLVKMCGAFFYAEGFWQIGQITKKTKGIVRWRGLSFSFMNVFQ